MKIETVNDFASIFANSSSYFDFYILPNTADIGIVNPDQSLENMIDLEERAINAARNSAYIEYTSLLMQYLDIFLRIYIAMKQNKATKIMDKPQFGQLVNECEKMGFRSDLIDELKKFNNTRKEIVHNYLLGGVKPSDLEGIVSYYKGFGMKVRDYIIREVGVKISTPEELPEEVGSTMFQLRKVS